MHGMQIKKLPTWYSCMRLKKEEEEDRNWVSLLLLLELARASKDFTYHRQGLVF